MANQPPIVNFDELSLESYGKGDDFQSGLGRITKQLGMTKLGCTLVELAPGKRAWPYHLHYANDELFVVMTGEGTLRYDGAEHPIRAGDVIYTPTGEGTAHQIVNTSDAVLRYLAISSMEQTDVCVYPDSGKVGSYAGQDFRFLVRQDDGRDYWDGETD